MPAATAGILQATRLPLQKSRRASCEKVALWAGRNGRTRLQFVKYVRQLRFLKIAWDGELTTVNRVVTHGGNRARDFRSVRRMGSLRAYLQPFPC